MLKTLAKIRSLPKFKEALKYAWNKVQTEIQRYWKRRKIDIKKTVLNEDARLMIIAFVLTQASDCLQELVPMLYAVQSFVNDTLYEECAPLATFESAFKVISFEFEEHVVNH